VSKDYTKKESCAVGKTRMLMTKGNRIVLKEDNNTEVRLCGVNIAGGEWVGNPDEEYVKRSLKR
jgi:hypothetical protein